MANQHKSALQHAVEELAVECAEANIFFSPEQRTLTWSGIVFTIEQGTTKVECLRKIRKIIDFDKKIKVRKNQGALL